MRDLIRFADLQSDEVFDIFSITDEINKGKYNNFLDKKSIVLFFPNSSIRTRVTFEKGIYLLGGQPILLPSNALDKREDIEHVCGYLDNWTNIVVVRHKSMQLVEKLAKYLKVPVINAMTDDNHPCEILADLYSLSKIRSNFIRDNYLFCGKAGNIGQTWKEASKVIGFDLSQCCDAGYEMDDVKIYHDIRKAIKGKDIVCTDSLNTDIQNDFFNCQVTKEIMDMANDGAILNPCPPFYCGEEVSKDVIQSNYFVGYEFKKSLLVVQQAIIIWCIIRDKYF